MERLLIFLAVLIVVAIGALVLRMASRGRRPPLRMDSDFHDDDTDVLIGPIRRRGESPIDRSAQVIDVMPHPVDPPNEPAAPGHER
ncbi:MAG: hypothetical protein INR70_17345 [Parafilimonas terrae]|nr:hypothetical protein [Parafilimonas terrae]